MSARPCFCACHEYPGTYPTGPDKPCGYCAHIDAEGVMLGTLRDGWTPRAIEIDARTAPEARP